MQMTGGETEQQIESGFKSLGDEELSKAIEKIVPKHCSNLKGIQKKQNGSIEEATVSDMVEHGASVSFFLPVLIQLLNITSVSQEDQTKLKKQ